MATTKVSGELVDLNESTSESGLKIPSGTELNRPATGVAGMIRNNTNESSDNSASCEEYYNGTEWKKINNVAIPPPLAFKTIIYNGNGTSQSITGLGFQPDLVWIKERGPLAENHNLTDSTRGTNKILNSNSTSAEITSTSRITSFDTGGFTLGNNNETNDTGSTYVAWAWKASGGTTSSNTDGSITSTVQANTDAGFSIVKWDGTGAINTVGHGLSAAPELILIKPLDQASDWQVYSEPTGNGNKLSLNTSAAASSTTRWDSTSPTATVFTLRDIGLGTGQIAYCFHSVSNFSKIGSYSGSGASGNAQNVGFAPDLVILKSTNATTDWAMFDTVRGGNVLYADLANAESADNRVTLTSTGFEFTGAAYNETGRDWIYIALKTN